MCYFVLVYHIKSQQNTFKFVIVKNMKKFKGYEYFFKALYACLRIHACVAGSLISWKAWSSLFDDKDRITNVLTLNM